MLKPPVNMQDLKNCVLEAGEILLSYYKKDLVVSAKKDLSPVTEADNAVNSFLQKSLHALFPLAGWLSEESALSPERHNNSWLWVVDPLDGTKEFITGIPEFSISIGLIYKGLPVLGTVYNPIAKNGAVGNVSSRHLDFWGNKVDLGESIVVSRTEYSKPKMQFMLQRGLKLEPVGSVAYKLLLVANSGADATFSLEPKSEWDICGGVALLLAGGFQFKRYDKEDLFFNMRDPLIKSWTVGGKSNVIDYISDQIEKHETELKGLG